MITMKTTFRECTVSAAAIKWIGLRERQEDQVEFCTGPCVEAPCMLALLADGMGGMGNGDVAGALIVNGYLEHYRRAACTVEQVDYLRLANSAPLAVADDHETGFELLAECLQVANNSLAEEKLKGGMTEGAGATLIALHVTPGGIWWQSIGDSLLYHIQGATVNKINVAHNWGQLIDRDLQAGIITPEQAEGQRHMRHALHSAVCGTVIPEIQYCRTPLQVGDRFIIASDGLQPLIDAGWEHMLHVPELRDASAAEVCEILIEALQCVEYPYQDNTAIAVLDILPPVETTQQVGYAVAEEEDEVITGTPVLSPEEQARLEAAADVMAAVPEQVPGATGV
ncbi:MAG: protein phosphatase 2C domain-containing protein [Akkermansia sp.]|nr:protein phosphatase 2C domain-containing protein [Akkermansia sp.]